MRGVRAKLTQPGSHIEAAMISLKKYLESQQTDSVAPVKCAEGDLFPVVIDAYGSALMEMGNSSMEACPGMGDELKRRLSELKTGLSVAMSPAAMATTDSGVREQIRGWGRGTAKHFQQKACEVKEMLLMMARTAESVGTRDQRCAGRMSEVTERLKAIVSLDDLTEIRTSIEKSASELKSSIDRMTAEGKAVLDQLKEQVATYQTKLEEAEEIASRDALTGLSSRLYFEGQLEKRMAAEAPFCVAIVDIDRFKKVNDDHGHVTGDDLLKQFSTAATNVLADGAAGLDIQWNLLGTGGTPNISQVYTASAVSGTDANGYKSGTFQQFTINSDGTVSAKYSNGQNQTVGQIALANVTNLQGLQLLGDGDYATTLASGTATVGAAGTGGLATIEDDALEASNVNISSEFSDLIVAQRAFEANAKSVTTFDTVTQDTINMVH